MEGPQRIELCSLGSKPKVLPLNDNPIFGAYAQSEWQDLHLHISGSKPDPHLFLDSHSDSTHAHNLRGDLRESNPFRQTHNLECIPRTPKSHLRLRIYLNCFRYRNLLPQERLMEMRMYE